jgi:hypothetical protein
MDRQSLHLGAWRPLDGSKGGPFRLPAHHLVTQGVVVGATGSGKTGLLMVLAEEALRAQIPVLVIDVKGDLPNLLLSFPTLAPSELLPWASAAAAANDARAHAAIAAELAEERRRGLAAWSIGELELAAFRASTSVRVITPGASAGELLHVLSSLERRSDRWEHDPESARAALSAAISLVLRLLGRDPDPAKSREHVLLAVLAERRLLAGESADIGVLLEDLAHPPITRIGALELEAFFPKRSRRDLAASLNTLLASPTFTSWRQGTTLDVGAWLTPQAGRTPAVVVSVAHLDDDERALVLGVLLEEVVTWVRSLPGSQRLRAMVAFDLDGLTLGDTGRDDETQPSERGCLDRILQLEDGSTGRAPDVVPVWDPQTSARPGRAWHRPHDRGPLAATTRWYARLGAHERRNLSKSRYC